MKKAFVLTSCIEHTTVQGGCFKKKNSLEVFKLPNFIVSDQIFANTSQLISIYLKILLSDLLSVSPENSLGACLQLGEMYFIFLKITFFICIFLAMPCFFLNFKYCNLFLILTI